MFKYDCWTEIIAAQFIQPFPVSTLDTALSCSETHDAVHGSFVNLMKLPNVETLIFLVPASNHFMF